MCPWWTEAGWIGWLWWPAGSEAALPWTFHQHWPASTSWFTCYTNNTMAPFIQVADFIDPCLMTSPRARATFSMVYRDLALHSTSCLHVDKRWLVPHKIHQKTNLILRSRFSPGLKAGKTQCPTPKFLLKGQFRSPPGLQEKHSSSLLGTQRAPVRSCMFFPPTGLCGDRGNMITLRHWQKGQ